jgi:Esterase FrsA-like
MEWSIRDLINPVITRLLIYGVNPIDTEYVVSNVEKVNYLNSRSLENSWAGEWKKKAQYYTNLAETAIENDNKLTAGELYMQAAQCYYAMFLINMSSTADKKKVYEEYSSLFKRSMNYRGVNVTDQDIILSGGKVLRGQLYFPSKGVPVKKICTIIYSGLGSCKEEMYTLASPLLDRGASVFIADMPGNGESLFSNGVTCNINVLEEAFSAIPQQLSEIPELKGYRFGAYGLCMGGGYAVRAACKDARYEFCATLFALLISKVEANSTPQWMKQGEWAKIQMGNIPAEQFIDEMRLLESGTFKAPYFFIHGKHDNWMTLESALEFCKRSQGTVKKLIVETEPVFSNQQIVTHTMPVGEQLHWVRHVVADWIVSAVS